MTIFDLLFKNAKYRPNEPAISWQEGQKSFRLSNSELWIELKKIISFLRDVGIEAGDKVGIFAHTSGYWHLADLSIMAIGATTVPLYPTASSTELAFIIKDSQISSIIVEDENARIKVEAINPDLSIISLKETNHQNYFLKYREHEGQQTDEVLKQIKQSVENHPASIIYTSGTTSTPKGVVTEHKAIMAVLSGIKNQMKGKVSEGDISLTSLPLSHVLGRCDSLLHLCLPIETYFGESPKTFMNDLRVSKPSYIITVPRIIEKMRERIEAIVQNKGKLFSKIFTLNYAIANSYFEKVDSGGIPSNLEKKVFIKIQKYFFSKIRKQISPSLKFLVSGGAKLGPGTYRFFRNIGVPILEGYGLTETFGPAFLNSQFNSAPGHVGFPLPGIKMKFASDGEILLKGESIFECYQGLELNSFFDEDGYFKTGDIGQWSVTDGLRITDRKKDIIVTSGGKNIAPAKVESLMNGCSHISHFMLVGDSRKYLTGLVSIDKESFADLIERGELAPGIEHDELSQNPAIIKIIDGEIREINKQLAHYERVKQFYIIPVSIAPGSLYLSTSMKLKKDKLFNKYIAEINAMY